MAMPRIRLSDKLNRFKMLSKGRDALVDYTSLFVLYESVDFLDPSARIYPVKSYSPGDTISNRFGVALPDLPRTFLFWTDNTMSPYLLLAQIRQCGYRVSDTIEWGVTTVYVFEEKKPK